MNILQNSLDVLERVWRLLPKVLMIIVCKTFKLVYFVIFSFKKLYVSVDIVELGIEQTYDPFNSSDQLNFNGQ